MKSLLVTDSIKFCLISNRYNQEFGYPWKIEKQISIQTIKVSKITRHISFICLLYFYFTCYVAGMYLKPEHILFFNVYKYLFYRIKLAGLRILRPPKNIARYKMLRHKKQVPAKWNSRLIQIII